MCSFDLRLLSLMWLNQSIASSQRFARGSPISSAFISKRRQIRVHRLGAESLTTANSAGPAYFTGPTISLALSAEVMRVVLDFARHRLWRRQRRHLRDNLIGHQIVRSQIWS